jgi:hypothetical protein
MPSRSLDGRAVIASYPPGGSAFATVNFRIARDSAVSGRETLIVCVEIAPGARAGHITEGEGQLSIETSPRARVKAGG